LGVSLAIGSWTDFWLNEGFATFMVAVDKERLSPSTEIR